MYSWNELWINFRTWQSRLVNFTETRFDKKIQQKNPKFLIQGKFWFLGNQYADTNFLRSIKHSHEHLMETSLFCLFQWYTVTPKITERNYTRSTSLRRLHCSPKQTEQQSIKMKMLIYFGLSGVNFSVQDPTGNTLKCTKNESPKTSSQEEMIRSSSDVQSGQNHNVKQLPTSSRTGHLSH